MMYAPADAEFLIDDMVLFHTNQWYRTSKISAETDLEGPNFAEPNVFRGGNQGARPKLILTDNNRRFQSTSVPRAMVALFSRHPSNLWNPKQNEAMAQEVIGIDLDTGTGNPGAVGFNWRGAQGCGVRDSIIDATGSLAGFDGITGSGGANMNVEVIGGQYAIIGQDAHDYKGDDAEQDAQPAPLICGLKAHGQTVDIIKYHAQSALTLKGCDLVVPVGSRFFSSKNANGAWTVDRGQLVVLNSKIAFEGQDAGNIAIQTRRSVYIANTYMRYATTMVDYYDGVAIDRAGRADGWRLVIEYGAGIDGPLSQNSNAQYSQPIWRDGLRLGNETGWVEGVNYVDVADGSVPADVVSAAVPQSLAHIDDPDAVWFGAGLDLTGYTNLTDEIKTFVANNPKGLFPKMIAWIDEQVLGRTDTNLGGVGRSLARWVVRYSTDAIAGDFAVKAPMFLSAATGSTVLSDFCFHAPVEHPNVECFHIRNTYEICNIHIDTDDAFGFASMPQQRGSSPQGKVLCRIEGANATGHLWNLSEGRDYKQTADYRMLLVKDTDLPNELDDVNCEHIKSDCAIEVDNARATFTVVKHEGQFWVIWCRNGAKVKLYSMGGNGCAWWHNDHPNNWVSGSGDPEKAAKHLSPDEGDAPNYDPTTPSLVRITDCPDVKVVMTQNIDKGTETPGSRNPRPVFGFSVGPKHFHFLSDHVDTGVGSPLLTPCQQAGGSTNDRPLIYERGDVDA